MEIETKIFDIKKVRKVLEKKEITPKRICDITDFFFRIADFSAKNWKYALPRDKESGVLSLGIVSVEIPDTEILIQIRDFAERGFAKWSKIRLRSVDGVPYITIKWPKKTQKGIKSREEIETRIGSLSDMMQLLLMSGARFEKGIGRIREIYHLPGYSEVELVIDSFQSAHGILEYAEIECSSEEELATVLKKVFKMDIADMSHVGITGLHNKKMEKWVSRKIQALEELL